MVDYTQIKIQMINKWITLANLAPDALTREEALVVLIPDIPVLTPRKFLPPVS